MIELKKTVFFRSAIEAISAFIPEGNFRFNDKGVHFRAIDPSQIVLVDFFAASNQFDSFDVEPAFVGMNITELNKIIMRAFPEDRLVIDLGDSECGIRFEGTLKRSFNLPLIDVSDDELKLPKDDYDVVVEINARLLKEALKDASLFSSSVILQVKNNIFILESSGNSGNLHIDSSNSGGVKVKSKEEVVSKYSLGHLQNIVKEADSDSLIKLEFKSDSPMKVTFPVGGSELKFYLAHMLL